ncbi:MAG: hypothetical protein QXQ36_07195 [Sulfolobales archaeon]
MKYSLEILKIGSDPRISLEDKAGIVLELVRRAVDEVETYLLFIEDVLRELLEKAI